MDNFQFQFGNTDTLASQMAAGATSATLSSGNFDAFTADYLVLDYNNPSKREVIRCNVSGTAITSATRAIFESDVTHSAGAAVAYGWLPTHADYMRDSLVNGWVEVALTETWVYASASTFTIAGVDVTAKYTKGTKLRFKQGAGYKYANVASSTFSTNTTVTIIVNTDYTIANSAITDNAYSYVENPQGWVEWFNYTTTFGGFSADPATPICRYKASGRTLTVQIRMPNAGTSNATGFTVTGPVAAATVASNSIMTSSMFAVDNGATSTTKDYGAITSASSTITLLKAASATGWTNSSTKRADFTVIYDF